MVYKTMIHALAVNISFGMRMVSISTNKNMYNLQSIMFSGYSSQSEFGTRSYYICGHINRLLFFPYSPHQGKTMKAYIQDH